MTKALTFVIPVRHQDNAKDWKRLKTILSETIRSIVLQTSDDWRAIVVANHGADLPEMPSGFEIVRVDFPPNQLYEKDSADLEYIYEAVRIDKGRRVLSGMLQAGAMQHVMIVDDDDFVSNKLAKYVSTNRQQFGWYIQNGYVWGEDTNYLYLHPDFSNLCGTSLIIRSDLYELPQVFEEASDAYIRRMLGSHIFIKGYLEKRKTPLAFLPFVGAVYRVGHPGAHSKSQSVFAQYFLQKWLLKRPLELIRRFFRLRYLTCSIRREYFKK
jgi:glycosyltransferase involved in cell wall biosynthesis